MIPFATLPPAERALIVNEAAGRLGLVPLIVEKDFWVCWTLGRIFEVEAVTPHVVFKGGTSLSKVFGAIQRFSEDIDLAVSPQALGFTAAELDEAPSASQRRKRVQALEAECERCVAERFRPALEAAIAARLGAPQQANSWLRYEIDALAGTPNLLFTYPSALAQAGGYIAKQVKLEFGALTDQQPTGTHGIAALLAQTPGVDLASAYDDLRANVVALEITRTFWEKATILHAEHYRPLDLPIRDRFARHYADFEALWRHASRCARQTRSARRRGAPQGPLLLFRLDPLRDRHARDVQARSAACAPCCIGEGLCDDGTDVHRRANRVRCHVAAPSGRGAAAQRGGSASFHMILFRWGYDLGYLQII
jgi:hypothetical protein